MTEIYIYDEIGPSEWGYYDDKTLIADLADVEPDEPVTVRINSPGGDAFRGVSIYNGLTRHQGEVTIEIDALAASAASIVAMAGDHINMADNAMLMVHNAWSIAMGDRREMERAASLLGKVDAQMRLLYAGQTEATTEQVGEWMDKETWFTADEALQAGLVDSVGESLDVQVVWSTDLHFQRVPDQLAARLTSFPRRMGQKADQTYRQARHAHLNRRIREAKLALARAS